MRRRMNAVVWGLLCGLAASSCAQEREPINKVQPNALDKHFFLGGDLRASDDDPEFYTRAYSVGASFDQPAFHYGTGSGVDRIRFEITEDLLIARKAYQVGRGRDDKGLADGDPNGTVVAAYRIDSHFDIRKGYNPATGETLNIIEENTTDRPWYERQYMRVDWSTNEVTNPMYLEEMLSRWFGEPKITPMRYEVTDPNSEDAPLFDEDDGYLEITNRYYVEPGDIQFSWGKVPSCFIYGMYSGTNVNDCNMQSAHIRLSFWRVDPERDFEPFINSHASEDVVNNFGSIGNSIQVQWGAPIQDYDPAYGFTDEGYHVAMQHINIWEKSHVDIACNDAIDGDNDGTSDQCGGYVGSRGSRCDTFTGKCTIPYRDRTVKTVGWFVNKEMPLDYQDPLDAAGNPLERGAVEDVVYSWNQMMTASVAFARAAECRRTGDGDRASCNAAYFAPDKQMVSYGGWLIDTPLDTKPVFTLCHNPVRHYDDPAACGAPGDETRVGDLRKFMLLDWPYATNAPFGGVTSIQSDPTTGELIGDTSLTVHIEARAQRILDTFLVAMGDMTLDEYMGGASSERYAKVMSGPLPTEPLTQEEIERRIETIDKFHLVQSSAADNKPTATRIQALKEAIRAKTELKADEELRAMQALRSDQLLEPLRGTAFESQLTDPHWMTAAGVDPRSELSEDVLYSASPLRTMDATKIQQMRAEMENRFALAGAGFTDLQQASQMGQVINAPLANYFLQKYGHLTREERIAAMRQELRIETFKGVMLHEMGHALGMRHQFSSTWDAPNYMPQYWQLRTNEGQSTASCEGKPRDTTQPDSCMGPPLPRPPHAR